MDATKIGVHLDDFRLPPREALPTAARLGYRAVEVGLSGGELAEAAQTDSGRRHIVRFARDHRLSVAAVSADFPGLQLTDPVRVEERVDRTRAILYAAGRMRVPVVTAAVAALTDGATGAPKPAVMDALRQVARDAERAGVIYAIRPSADVPEHLARLLSDLGTPHLRLCLDPAALLMSGASPQRLISLCPGDIVLSHARDATTGVAGRGGMETSIGEGDVDWPGYLLLLEVSGYHGPHIVRRMTAGQPMRELAAAREYLADLHTGDRD